MVIKTLDEINRTFILENISNYSCDTAETANPSFLAGLLSRIKARYAEHSKQKSIYKKADLFAVISDILFYLAILGVLLSALVTGRSNEAPKMILGYSYFTVLSSSMQAEIPKGSFILVHRTDTQKLVIGDNITFKRDKSTSVTHKITDIFDNYQNSGVRGFQTKGVNNANPDKDIVHEANIIGKVIFVLPVAGAVISYLGANVYIVFVIFGLCILLSFCIRGLLKKS